MAELIAELEQRFMSHMTSKIIQQRHPMIARDFIHQHDESTTNVVLLSELRRCTSARARDQARSSTRDDQSATRLGRESHRCEIDTSRVLHESETEIREMRQVGIVLDVG